MKRPYLPLLSALVFSSTALAQQNDRALGETLFADAKKAMEAGNYGEACPKFDDSYQAYPGTGTLLNSAACYEAAGKLATAWGRYGEAIAAAKRDGAQDRVSYAQEHRAAIEPKLSHLTVKVDETTKALDGLEIRVNGRPLPKSAFGLSVPTDAGAVKVEATAPGKKPFSRELSLGQAKQESVTIGALEDGPAETTAAPAPASTAAPEHEEQQPPAAAGQQQSSSSGQKVLGYTLGGVGIIGLGVGAVFNVLARSAADEAQERCLPDSASGQCDLTSTEEVTARQNNLNAAESDALVSYISLGVGAAALTTGAILILTAPSGESSGQARVVPTIAPGFAGVSVKGAL